MNKRIEEIVKNREVSLALFMVGLVIVVTIVNPVFIKPQNIIVPPDGELNLIDWSRAGYGDWAQELSYIALSTLIYDSPEKATEVYERSVDMLENTQGLGDNFPQRMQFYTSSLMFSVARVFHHDELDNACQAILKPGSSYQEFLDGQNWLHSKHF